MLAIVLCLPREHPSARCMCVCVCVRVCVPPQAWQTYRAEVQRRLAETKETFYLQQAETAKAQKRALARMLDESASSQQDASFDFSVQASKIQALITQGKTDEANEATENLNRAVVPAAGPSASA